MTHTDILITTYQGAYLSKGGGELEIIQLQRALNQSGYIADLYGPQSRAISVYNTVIHFSLSEDSASFLRQMRKIVPQMVLWPNFWVVDAMSAERQAQLQRLVDLFDIVVFKSHAESNHFRNLFDVSNLEVVLISPGIPSEIYQAQQSRLFNEVHGLEKYIIWPGIIEPQKNQLTAIQALRGCGIPLVFVGAVRDEDYISACKYAAGPDVLFLPDMPFMSEIHLSALMNCEIFLELPLDFPGTSAVEAAGLGCNLVLTDCAWSREVLGRDALLTDPTNSKAIRASLELALSSGGVGVNRERYRKHVLPLAFEPLMNHL